MSGSPSSFRRIGLRLTLVGSGIALALLGVEGGLRFLLYHQAPWVRRASVGLREAGHFAPRTSSDYWKLTYLLADEGLRMREPTLDPRLGWRGARIRPDYLHQGIERLGGRRPLLLFGDSFAQMTERHGAWGEWLGEAPEGQPFVLLNHGCGGYGVDQILLSFLASIEGYAAHRPKVVFSVMVDDDLDRDVLSFRAWPRPQLLAEGEDVREGPPMLAPDTPTWLAQNPPEIRSYLGRFLLHGTSLVPDGLRRRLVPDDHRQRVGEVTHAIVARLAREVRERDLDAFVLVFHGLPGLRRLDWREELLLGELQRQGLPFVLSSTELIEDQVASGRPPEAYFITRGSGRGHYNELGNRVTLRTLRRGLRGEYESGSTERQPVRPPTRGGADESR